MDLQQIITSVASALAVLILSGIFNIMRNWIKRSEKREKLKELRMVRYFRKTDAILYAFAVASDKIVAETFQQAYTEKLKELETEDELLKNTE